MTDLDEIVEGFKLNIDRVTTERLTEVLGMVATEINRRIPASENVSRARLNEILDKIVEEYEAYPKTPAIGSESMVFIATAKAFRNRVREEIQKVV